MKRSTTGLPFDRPRDGWELVGVLPSRLSENLPFTDRQGFLPQPHGQPGEIDTNLTEDHPLSHRGPHLACARTWYVPAVFQALVAFVDGIQPEYVPSPQSKRYAMVCPPPQATPPVEYVTVRPTMPEDGPSGVLGMLSSCGAIVPHPASMSMRPTMVRTLSPISQRTCAPFRQFSSAAARITTGSGCNTRQGKNLKDTASPHSGGGLYSTI